MIYIDDIAANSFVIFKNYNYFLSCLIEEMKSNLKPVQDLILILLYKDVKYINFHIGSNAKKYITKSNLENLRFYFDLYKPLALN